MGRDKTLARVQTLCKTWQTITAHLTVLAHNYSAYNFDLDEWKMVKKNYL